MDAIGFDFETTGLYPYHGATITHLAIAHANGKVLVFEAHEIDTGIQYLVDNRLSLVVWNMAFDLSFIKYYYPQHYDDILSRTYDAMRLRAGYAVWDENEGLGLKAATLTYLPDLASYEADLKLWCQGQGLKGDFRAHLAQMPSDMVLKYVATDAIATIRLFNRFITKLADTPWEKDHDLYRYNTNLLIDSQTRGLVVDRERIETCRAMYDAQVNEHYDAFRKQHAEDIERVIELMWDAEKAKRKTEKGKAGVPRPTFNPNSNTQLAMLFCQIQGQIPKIKTEKGAPSFKNAHLNQWVGSEHLQGVGKTAIISRFCENMLEQTEIDGLWHPQLKLTGTVTYRCAGAGGLNIQALPRRNKDFMSCVLPREGNIFASIDSVGCEPTVISEYTGDVNYKNIVFDMKGKTPHWINNTLILDDIYLSVLSMTPFGRTYLKDIWDNHRFPAGSFAEQWLVDSEVVKAVVKKYRTIAKIAVLASGYSAGPTKIHKAINEAGFVISETDARNLHNAFWKLFAGVKRYAEDCSKNALANGLRVINRFGQVMWLTSPHKAFNAEIQSSVNPIMQEFTRFLLQQSPYAHFVTFVHDEAIIELPVDKVEEFKAAHAIATQKVNEFLDWKRVKMSFGFAVGANLYEAK